MDQTSFGVEILYAGGGRSGIRKARVLGSNCLVIASSTDHHRALLGLPEIKERSGAYILYGDDRDPTNLGVYIGQATVLAERLRRQRDAWASGGLEFWDHTIAITSTDNWLGDFQSRFLEHRLIGIAQGAPNVAMPKTSLPSRLGSPGSVVH